VKERCTRGKENNERKKKRQKIPPISANEQSPFILTHRTQKRITTYDVGNPGSSLGQIQTM
jgi:hypothetical protein